MASLRDWLRRLRGIPLPGQRITRPAERFGTEYGGAVVCPDALTRESVVYSAGVGEDITFDLALVERFGVTVHAFDPTPRSIAWVNAQDLPREFRMHGYGFAAYDGVAHFTPPRNPKNVSHTILEAPDRKQPPIEAPMRRLATAMRELGHGHIDLLKLDIEGAEFEVIEDLLRSGIPVHQLVVEFHHRFLPGLGFRRTEAAVRRLNQAGYAAFYVSAEGKDFGFLHGA